MASAWLKRWGKSWFQGRTGARRPAPPTARPGVEALEDRKVPAALSSLSLSVSRENPLALGDVFVGRQFQLGITATDVNGNPWTGSVSLNNTNGPDEGFAIPLGNPTISVTNGYGSIYLTPQESYASMAQEADVITATQVLPQSSTKTPVSTKTTIIAITSGFEFTVYSNYTSSAKELKIYVPTDNAGGVVTITNESTGKTQTTNITWGILGTSYNGLYNWVLNRIEDHSGNPGTPTNLQNNFSAAYSDILAIASLDGVAWLGGANVNLGPGILTAN